MFRRDYIGTAIVDNPNPRGEIAGSTASDVRSEITPRSRVAQSLRLETGCPTCLMCAPLSLDLYIPHTGQLELETARLSVESEVGSVVASAYDEPYAMDKAIGIGHWRIKAPIGVQLPWPDPEDTQPTLN